MRDEWLMTFYLKYRYEASEGTTRVQRRKEKRFVDLAASRGELIEVSIEAVFEPMVSQPVDKDADAFSVFYVNTGHIRNCL